MISNIVSRGRQGYWAAVFSRGLLEVMKRKEKKDKRYRWKTTDNRRSKLNPHFTTALQKKYKKHANII